MNEHNFCMGCQYYNKPYWSIVSPCASCPRIYGTDRFATIATTNIKMEKSNDVITNLPTAKEYRETAKKPAFRSTSQWSEPKYQCPKCGGGMCRNEMVVLTSSPAQYEYQCNKCGYVDYQYI